MPDWLCKQCRSEVPESMDACWSCGTGRDGTPDPNFVPEIDITAVPVGEPGPGLRPAPSPRPAGTARCPRCQSDKVIPGASLVEEGYVRVQVCGRPDALVFKDRMASPVVVDVCGACGHLDLRAERPEDLYEHFLRSRE